MQINKKGIESWLQKDQCSANIRNQFFFSVVTVQAEIFGNLWTDIAWATPIGIKSFHKKWITGGKNKREGEGRETGSVSSVRPLAESLRSGPGTWVRGLVCVLAWEVVALQRVQQGQWDSLWTFGTPPHRGRSRSGCREGLHGAQMSDRFCFDILMPLSHRRTNWDYRYVFLVKGVQRGNSGEQILFQRHLHLPVPMPDLGLRFPPTATRTSMSFSVHWQGERETVCVCVCEPVVWPPWDPVRLQHVIYSNSVQHVFCQMGKCVYIWRLVLGRVSCGGWMFWSCCSDCKPLGVGDERDPEGRTPPKMCFLHQVFSCPVTDTAFSPSLWIKQAQFQAILKIYQIQFIINTFYNTQHTHTHTINSYINYIHT